MEASTPLGVLTRDLLRLILSYIPARPRLLVVSCVSKRWRKIVLETITSIPRHCIGLRKPSQVDMKPLLLLVALCPHLDRLPNTRRWMTVNWESVPRLERLTQWTMNSSTNTISRGEADFLRSCTNLTAISIRSAGLAQLRTHGVSLDSFPHLSEILLQPPLNEPSPADLSEWQTLALPALTSLVSLVTRTASELTYLASHFSKLRTLTFCVGSELTAVLSLPSSFPSLTELSVLVVSADPGPTEEMTYSLLRCCPQLRLLHGFQVSHNPGSQVPALIAPLRKDATLEQDLPILHLMTQLTHLHIGTAPFTPPHPAHFLSRLTRLSMPYRELVDLSPCLSLRHLSVILSQPLAVEDLLARYWRLPLLEYLTLQISIDSEGFGELALPLLQASFPPSSPPFPRLCSLEVDLYEPPHNISPETGLGNHFDDFVNCIPRIEASGVLVLKVLQALPEESEVLYSERSRTMWLEIDPNLPMI